MDNLLLLSGNDIPFPQGQVTIHQPTIKEIAYIGEESFFMGCQLLNFSKNILSKEDKTNLENVSNFEVLMSIMMDKSKSLQQQKLNVLMVLTLLFPTRRIEYRDSSIVLTDNETGEFGLINKNNFEDFKQVLVEMFDLKTFKDEEYNPAGDRARQIAEKLNERKRKLAELKKGDGEKIDILGRYISILSVGLQKDMNVLFGYTVYQLYDEFKRYEAKMSFDFYVQAKAAGAQDIKEVEDWMRDLHK